MDLRPFANGLMKDLGAAASQFLPVLVHQNATPGFIHEIHAAILHDAGLPADIACFRDNQLIIGLGAETASKTTQVLSQITAVFANKGTFQPSGEKLRVTPEYVDGKWKVLRPLTPYCDVQTSRIIGVGIDSAALVKRDRKNRRQFILAKRAEGNGKGQFDITAIGKHDAKDRGVRAVFKETKGETGCRPICNSKDPECLKYLGTVHTAHIHDNRLFHRRIRVHIGGLDGEKQITGEVAGYESFSPEALINPPQGVILQPHVLPIIGYVLAHELDNQAYINLAHQPINTIASGSIAGAVKARFAPQPYDR
ncbi:MAG: hypothetical protein K2Q32_03170 [Alphaproteobacteria bacterium]|nr:hypothetical protein [Alphaproteobacteria bacterium]